MIVWEWVLEFRWQETFGIKWVFVCNAIQGIFWFQEKLTLGVEENYEIHQWLGSLFHRNITLAAKISPASGYSISEIVWKGGQVDALRSWVDLYISPKLLDYCSPPTQVHLFPPSTPRHPIVRWHLLHGTEHGYGQLNMSLFPEHSGLWQRRHCRILRLRTAPSTTRRRFVGRCGPAAGPGPPLRIKVYYSHSSLGKGHSQSQ